MRPRQPTVLAVGVGAVGLAAATAAVLRTRRARGPVPVRARPPSDPAVSAGYRGGSGEPLLLLHGITATWRAWKPVIPLLEAHHDVIVPTLPGHSGAEPLGDGVEPSIDALVDVVTAELDRLGLDRVHVAGNSLGGWLAIELARRGRARSVVAFSPSGAWSSNLRLSALMAGMRWGVAGLGRQAHRADALTRRRWTRRLLARKQVEHPERLDPAEMAAAIRALGDAPVVEPLLRVLGQRPLQPLPDPGCPVRVVWAQRDRIIPFRHYGRPLLERLPSAELVMLPGVGHVPMSDAPDEVVRLILEVTGAVAQDSGGRR